MKLTNKTQIEMQARSVLLKPYSWVFLPQEEGGFSAEILEFPGCFAEGDTIEEAHSALASAAQTWVELSLEKGDSIPVPLTNYDISGKFALRLPRSLYMRAAKAALLDGTSLNQFIVECIAERLGAMQVIRRIENTVAEIRKLSKFVYLASVEHEANSLGQRPAQFPTNIRYDQEASSAQN